MSRVLSPEQRAERVALIAQQRAAGVQWDAIGAALGVSPHTIMDWFHHATARARKVKAMAEMPPPAAPERFTLKCIRCREEFASVCRRSHRMCDPCRAYASGASPYSPYQGGHTGTRVGRPR